MENRTAKDAGGDRMNKLKEIREARLLSKSELAKRAGLVQLTIDRIEKGFACRIVYGPRKSLAWG